jgi:hypothetical protein
MNRIKRVRPGGALSAAAFGQLAGAVEGRRLGVRAGMTRIGDQEREPADSHIIGEFVVVNDAEARPIALDADGRAVYSVSLCDLDGAVIPGSLFDAIELATNRNVPDGRLIYVNPVAGDWGFLHALTYELVADDASWAVVDQADPDNPEGHGLGNAFNDDSGIVERRIYVHFDRGFGGAFEGYAVGYVSFSQVIDNTELVSTDGANLGDVKLSLVLSDFDPATITWNNQPALQAPVQTIRGPVGRMAIAAIWWAGEPHTGAGGSFGLCLRVSASADPYHLTFAPGVIAAQLLFP